MLAEQRRAHIVEMGEYAARRGQASPGSGVARTSSVTSSVARAWRCISDAGKAPVTGPNSILLIAADCHGRFIQTLKVRAMRMSRMPIQACQNRLKKNNKVARRIHCGANTARHSS